MVILEYVFNELHWQDKGISRNGKRLSHLRYIDDIVLISENKEELGQMLVRLAEKPAKIGLQMNLGTTKVMCREDPHIIIRNPVIEDVLNYVYLGHMISLRKSIQRDN